MRNHTVELMTEKLFEPGPPYAAWSTWFAVKNGNTGYWSASANRRSAST